MRRCLYVLSIVLVSTLIGVSAYPMGWKIKSPPKGITLISKTGMSYSIHESIKRATTGLEIFDIWGLSLNGRIGFAVEGSDNPRYIVDIDYNLKQLPELIENIPPLVVLEPVAWCVEQINKIPLVELSGGVGFGCDSDFEEKGVELTASIIRASW